MIEHNVRRVHYWTIGEHGFVCSKESDAPNAFSYAAAGIDCVGCGAIAPYADVAKMASLKNFGRLAAWVADKTYHDIVAPCDCTRCVARRVSGGLELIVAVTTNLDELDVSAILAGELSK